MPCADSEVSDERSNEQGDEGELADSQGEAVHFDVNKRESLEPGVKNGVNETLRCQ